MSGDSMIIGLWANALLVEPGGLGTAVSNTSEITDEERRDIFAAGNLLEKELVRDGIQTYDIRDSLRERRIPALLAYHLEKIPPEQFRLCSGGGQ